MSVLSEPWLRETQMFFVSAIRRFDKIEVTSSYASNRPYYKYSSSSRNGGNGLSWTRKQKYGSCREIFTQDEFRHLTTLQPFHTDYGDILSLYTLSRAATGGDFYLADINDIVAKIEKVRPDILETLRENWLMVK